MADNVTADAGSGGAVFATDDVSSVHYPIQKITIGALDSAGTLLTGNFGTVDAGCLRVSVATDDAITAAVELIGDATYIDDGDWTALTSRHMLSGGVYQSSPGSIVDGDTGPIRLTVNGAVHVSDAGGSLTVDGTELTTLAGAVSGTEMQVDVVTSALPTGAATAANQTTGNSSLSTVAGAVSGTEMQVDVVAALPAGTNAIGKLAANSGVDIGDVDVLSIAAGTNNIGQVSLAPQTSGGLSIAKSIDLDESEEAVKATAGQLYGIIAINLASSVRYLKLYNATVATVVVGTTVPDITIPIPTQGDTNGAGFVLNLPNGIEFSTAITMAATTGVGDADSGAPGANEVVVTMLYK